MSSLNSRFTATAIITTAFNTFCSPRQLPKFVPYNSPPKPKPMPRRIYKRPPPTPNELADINEIPRAIPGPKATSENRTTNSYKWEGKILGFTAFRHVSQQVYTNFTRLTYTDNKSNRKDGISLKDRQSYQSSLKELLEAPNVEGIDGRLGYLFKGNSLGNTLF